MVVMSDECISTMHATCSAMTSLAQGQVLPKQLLLVFVEEVYGNKMFNIQNKPNLRWLSRRLALQGQKTQRDDVHNGAELDMERQSARCVVWCGRIHAARRTASFEQDHLPA